VTFSKSLHGTLRLGGRSLAWEGRPVPNPSSLHDLLDHTCHALRDIRKEIAATDHLQAMVDIDSLIAVAQMEAERQLRSVRLRM
jgi:hypothetical protein